MSKIYSKRRALDLVILVTAALLVRVSFAQTWTPLRRVVELKNRPQINGKVLARIPAKTRLKELDKRGYWVKVEYQGKIGWVPMPEVRLVTAEEKSRIDVIHARSRQLGRMYEHTFKFRNSGTTSFSGTVVLIAYDSGQVAFRETFAFKEDPIPAQGEREAVVKAKSDVTSLEYTLER